MKSSEENSNNTTKWRAHDIVHYICDRERFRTQLMLKFTSVSDLVFKKVFTSVTDSELMKFFFTYVSSVADTNGLLGVATPVTTSCELPQTSWTIRTHAGTAMVT